MSDYHNYLARENHTYSLTDAEQAEVNALSEYNKEFYHWMRNEMNSHGKAMAGVLKAIEDTALMAQSH